ncbi:hypothetical protein [Ensifer canadensis]
MNTNTTTAPAIATISEKELWALFIATAWHSTSTVGVTVEQSKPEDLLRDPGAYGNLAEFSSTLADTVEEVDEPVAELDCFIDDLESYLENLKSVRDLFERLKSVLAIESDDDEQRYSNPVTGAAA